MEGLSKKNVTGDPLSTVLGFAAGAAQYGAVQGPTTPNDITGWVQLAVWVILTILGALGKLPKAAGAKALPFVLTALVATQAMAFEHTFPWAAAESSASLCPGCSRRLMTGAGVALTPVYRIPSGGGALIYHTKVPRDVTDWPMGVTINFTSEAASPSGNACFRICAAVVTLGQEFNLMDSLLLDSACTSTASVALGTQYQNQSAFPFATPLTPKDVTGAACSGTACNGGDLYVRLTRVASGSCTGGSTDNIEAITGTLLYQ
jgi:hypothetical protein